MKRNKGDDKQEAIRRSSEEEIHGDEQKVRRSKRLGRVMRRRRRTEQWEMSIECEKKQKERKKDKNHNEIKINKKNFYFINTNPGK